MILKRNYVAISEILRNKVEIAKLGKNETIEISLIEEIATELAHYFEKENPNFEGGLFLHSIIDGDIPIEPRSWKLKEKE